jgi:hypothetical protein
MKKFLLILFVSSMFSSLFAADNNAVASPGAVTSTAVPVQVTSTATTGLGIDAAATGSIGLSGFTFRFLNADKTGYEIPFSITYSSSYNNTNGVNYGFTLASGLRFVRPLLVKNFIRVNTLLGATISYSGNWSSYYSYDIYDPNYSRSNDTFLINPQFGLEVEIPVGGILSLPADTICITSTLILTGSAGYTMNYFDSKFTSSSVNFQFNSQSTGTSLLSVGLRYYF